MVSMPVSSTTFGEYRSAAKGKERKIENSGRTRGFYGTSLHSHNLQPRINHVSVPQDVPVGRRARGTRECKGDDKSSRTRRIEKVAPMGPGNGIPVLDSARNPRHYHVTKRRSTGGIVYAITNRWYRKDIGNLSDIDMLQRREEISPIDWFTIP